MSERIREPIFSGKKIIITAGGSGGHLYPATGLAKQIRCDNHGIDLLFVATGLDANPFFDRKEFSYLDVAGATFSGRSPLQILKSCKSIAAGFLQSRKILSKYRPDLVVGFGSYHSLPLLLGARSLGIPIVLHEQNSKPGKVIRFFSKRALLTGVYFPTVVSQLKGHCVELAMPLRNGYAKSIEHREMAEKYFELDPNKLTLLVFGGSQGARFINRAVSEALSRLKHKSDQFQVLHFTGDEIDVPLIQSRYQSAGIFSVVKKFEAHMNLAWAIADLCIVRAGAGTIAEQIEFEVPGILIPYPHAADGHQETNADYLVDVVGGGWKFLEKDLDANFLVKIFEPLIDRTNPLLLEIRKNIEIHRNQSTRSEFAEVIYTLLGNI